MRRSFCANSKCKNCVLKDPLVRNNQHMHEEVRNFIEKKGNQEFLVALNDLSEKDD